MANECLNLIEVSGSTEDVAAFVVEAKGQDGDAFDFSSLLKGEASPLPHEVGALRPAEPPEVVDDGDFRVATFTVVSKGVGPEALATRVARDRPALTLRLLTVEPGMRIASVAVLRGAESWTHDPTDLDWDAMSDDEDVEDRVLDVLYAESDSVVDDMRRAPQPAP